MTLKEWLTVQSVKTIWSRPRSFFHVNSNLSHFNTFGITVVKFCFIGHMFFGTFVDWLISLLVVIDVLTERGRRGRRKQTRYFVTSSQPFCIVCALMRHSRKTLKRLWSKWEIPPKNGKANRGLLPQGLTCYTIPFSIQPALIFSAEPDNPNMPWFGSHADRNGSPSMFWFQCILSMWKSYFPNTSAISLNDSLIN